MEPLGFYCYGCGEKLPDTATQGGNCSICVMKFASKGAPTGGAVQIITWNQVVQTANALESGRDPGLVNIDNYIAEVMQCINEHMSDASATSFSGQNTIWNGGKTVTVDYQGTRAGSGSTFWIDIQGQVGGGGAKRKSYWQIMVECAGVAPAQNVVEAAIGTSHTSNVTSAQKKKVGERVVIVRSTTVGRPN